jgi:hypothetical protein
VKIALKRVDCPGMPLWERVLARLIDRCTGRDGTFHAELLFDDGRSFTADPCRGVVTWRHDWQPGGWIFFDVGNADESAIRAWTSRHCHQRYDFAGVLGCWIHPVRHWRAHLYCSLAVVRALRFGRRKPLIPGTRVAPNDLLRYCVRSGFPRTQP